MYNFMPRQTQSSLDLPASTNWINLNFVDFCEIDMFELADKKIAAKRLKKCGAYPSALTGSGHLSPTISQLAWDAQISQVPGRRDPYDDLLQQTNESSTRK
ncbi:hypothetical protein NE237_026222 [Protea cynaroides]|uniref:Uncharacterized protein n=1 Tax=Protea cynaroides TaxID=273540 RepID=A0A9Q0H5R2_9MAGN|nr:hypothetical protein NE237_026222 [Protea cynaroides]